MGVAILVFEAILDQLGDRARAKEAAASAQVDRIASDHDALAAFARSHGVAEPLIPGGPTPLHAAVVHHFPDLVSEFVRDGAVPTDDDLLEATRARDAGMVRALTGPGSRAGGWSALNAAFEAGDTEMLALLADRHVDVAAALPQLMDPQKLALHPGEVDWQSLRIRWKGPSPKRIADEIRDYTPGNPDFPASENEVLSVLQGALASDLCIDKTLPSLPLEPWMRDSSLCPCNYCPYVRQINWAILAALYPQAVPALHQSKHVAMLRLLARAVVQAGADQEPILRTAVGERSVTILEILEDQGFDVHRVDGEFAASSFLGASDHQRMKEHLLAKGVRLRE